MRISVYEDEYYPVLVPQIAKPRKRRGVYEIDDGTYKKWTKIFEDFENAQAEIKKMLKEEERKHRRSICGFKLGSGGRKPC